MSSAPSARSSPRQLAFDVLQRFEKGGSDRLKADVLLQATMARRQAQKNAEPLSEQDRAFAHALVMGVLRHWFRLESWMLVLTRRPLKQMAPGVRTLLRLGLFQLDGLSQVPAYAALNTTVALAKAHRHPPKTVSFVNAVLREAQRRLEAGGFPVPVPEIDFPAFVLARYGWPEAWTAHLSPQYTPAQILAMAEAAQTPAPLAIRVNTLLLSPEAYRETLQAAGIACAPADETIPEGWILPAFAGSPRQLPGYAEGHFYVQDAASMWVSRWLNPQPGHNVLDLCAAPGSKTTHLAALMANQGRIAALDNKPERLRRLEENLARLHVTNVDVIAGDGLTWTPPVGLYDQVLVDAPCSGSGTLRRHPEILLALRKLDVTLFQAQQLALLKKGFDCLRPGGAMVYSTCSLLQAENHEVVARFLAETPTAVLEGEEQRLLNPQADGFYAARLLKQSL